MTELTVEVEFICHACDQPMGVRVECKGPGLQTGGGMPQVRVLCPNCGRGNRVKMSADGTVHAVVPHLEPRQFDLIWN